MTVDLPINHLKRALREGRPQIGLWSMLSSHISVEVIAGSGFDWLLLDTEHSPNELTMVQGQLVYERDCSDVDFPFVQRLAESGLHAMVAAPLVVEGRLFGVLVASRRQPDSFSSAECEFVRQLSEHVALAANQSQVNAALKQAYDDLRQTQQTVMRDERLRALGQMASGIAHDINNAISPEID